MFFPSLTKSGNTSCDGDKYVSRNNERIGSLLRSLRGRYNGNCDILIPAAVRVYACLHALLQGYLLHPSCPDRLLDFWLHVPGYSCRRERVRVSYPHRRAWL